jgi:hypothetical protein
MWLHGSDKFKENHYTIPNLRDLVTHDNNKYI